MGAYVEHSFRRGFILDEGRVRRIKDILESRLSKRPNPISPTYKVYRGDGYSYTTQRIDDVTCEDNEDWRRITRLDVTAEEKDRLNLTLIFGAKGVDLNIIGDDRDEVFLLFSDLRDYIQNEVAVVRVFTKDSSRLVSVVAFFLVLLPLFAPPAFRSLKPTSEEFNLALQSTEIIPKLNLLIESVASAGTQLPVRRAALTFLAMSIVMVLTLTDSLEKVGRYFFPGNEFVFGKQKQAFERRQRLRSNLLWMGVVGLAVSLVAGFIVWYATKTG